MKDKYVITIYIAISSSNDQSPADYNIVSKLDSDYSNKLLLYYLLYYFELNIYFSLNNQLVFSNHSYIFITYFPLDIFVRIT